MPEVPTIAESGIPGYQTNSWNALVVPRGTAPGIINRINVELGSILGSAEMRERFLQQGIEPNPGSPEEFARFVKEERVRFTRLIKATGIKAE
jgi:tripartite-type tricarboxylate transporter receptor subunit TctC